MEGEKDIGDILNALFGTQTTWIVLWGITQSISVTKSLPGTCASILKCEK
jgi:hypothetical protein